MKKVSVIIALLLVSWLVCACTSEKKAVEGNKQEKYNSNISQKAENTGSKLLFTENYNKAAKAAIENMTNAMDKAENDIKMGAMSLQFELPVNLMEIIVPDTAMILAEKQSDGRWEFKNAKSKIHKYTQMSLVEKNGIYEFSAEGKHISNDTDDTTVVVYDAQRDAFKLELKIFDGSKKLVSRHVHEFIKAGDGYYSQSYKYDSKGKDKLRVTKSYYSGRETKAATEIIAAGDSNFSIDSSIYLSAPASWVAFISNMKPKAMVLWDGTNGVMQESGKERKWSK